MHKIVPDNCKRYYKIPSFHAPEENRNCFIKSVVNRYNKSIDYSLYIVAASESDEALLIANQIFVSLAETEKPQKKSGKCYLPLPLWVTERGSGK